LRIIRELDILIPILILVYGIIYFTEVSSLPNDIDLLLIKPVFYILVATIIIYLALQFYKYYKRKDVSSNKEENDEFDGKKALYFSVLTIIYVFLLDYIGFIVLTFVYMTILMLGLGVKNKKIIILTPVILISLIYISLEILLNIKLPEGLLMFVGGVI